mgnify:CR=1 FL=1
MKVDIEDIQLALSQHGVDQKVARQIIEDVTQAAEDAKGGSAAKKKTKYKYLIVASDPDGTKKAQIENTPMWVFKVPDEEKHTDVLPRFYKGVYDFNAKSRKGRKNPIKTVGDGIQTVGSKHFKPNKSPILTKEPVIVLVTDNKIPTA